MVRPDSGSLDSGSSADGSNGPVTVERHGAVTVLMLDRPERRNAVDHPTLLALERALADISEGDSRAVVLTGRAPAFCAGADLTGVEAGEFNDTLGRVLRAFTAVTVPVVAAVDGPALGAGTQLVAVCDLRVATATSRFGIPAARLGLAVDRWTVRRLAREFTPAVARAMLLAAETFDGARLYGAGVVHRLGALDTALAWAEELAALAPLTIGAHKLALERDAGPLDDDAEVDRLRAAAWASIDAVEGRAAFLEKRPARFTGA